MPQDAVLTRRVMGMLSARLPELGLKSVADPRKYRGEENWPLASLLQMTLLGLLAGCKGLADVEVLSNELSPVTRRRMKIQRRVPDTTLRNALVKVAPAELCRLVRESAKRAGRRKALVSDGFPLDLVVLDGKVTAVEEMDNLYAQTHRDAGGLGACGLIRTITALLVTSTARVCLEVLPMGAKGNEMGFFKTAFQTLLENHRASFDIVSYDAGAYSAANAKLVTDAGKHYLLGLKDGRKFMRQKAEHVLGKSTGVMAESETMLSKRDNKRLEDAVSLGRQGPRTSHRGLSGRPPRPRSSSRLHLKRRVPTPNGLPQRIAGLRAEKLRRRPQLHPRSAGDHTLPPTSRLGSVATPRNPSTRILSDGNALADNSWRAASITRDSPRGVPMAPIRPHLRRIQLSGIQDDPFARSAELVQLQPSDFKRKGGRPIGLEGPRVKLVEPAYLGADQWFGERANNPFSLPKATSEGQFLFPDEPRFPSYVVEKGADGNEVRDDHGRMHWTLEKPVHLGQLVAYKAASDVSRAYEAWGRQPVEWGQGGKLVIYVHDSIELNAYYDRNDRALHMSVLPYVDKETGQPRLFEMASSYEISAHESGHAIHHVLKPFRSPEDSNFDAFGESMGDQTAMWVSLRDSERVKQLLTETGGDLSKSNALTAFGAERREPSGTSFLYRQADACRSPILSLLTAWSISPRHRIHSGGSRDSARLESTGDAGSAES